MKVKALGNSLERINSPIERIGFHLGKEFLESRHTEMIPPEILLGKWKTLAIKVAGVPLLARPCGATS